MPYNSRRGAGMDEPYDARPFWFDAEARERFRNERTARFGSHLPDCDEYPEDDFGGEKQVTVFDPWAQAS